MSLYTSILVEISRLKVTKEKSTPNINPFVCDEAFKLFLLIEKYRGRDELNCFQADTLMLILQHI